MPYSIEDLDILNGRNTAISGKLYLCDNGRSYVGTPDGRLRLEDKAIETTFEPIPSIPAINIQDAIEEIVSSSTTNAQNAVGSILTDTSSIDFTYNSITPSITADLTLTGVIDGTYGSATYSPQIIIDNQGRITSATNILISDTGVTSVSGTLNRITASPTTGAVVVDISASYIGQSSITTVGTLTSGTIGIGFTPITNSRLANSTISGVSLGGTLFSLTTSSGLLISTGLYNGSATSTIGIDTTIVTTLTTVQNLSNKTGLISQWTNDSGYLTSGGTITNADNVNITNDNTNGFKVYPTWVTTTTGHLPIYVSSSKLSFVPSTGILTSTGFSGPLTGNVTGNVSGTSLNVTGIVLPINGGTGIANNNSSTLAISGNFATTLTVTALTAVTLPTSGTLYGTQTGSITSAQLFNSLTNPTGITGSVVFANTPVFTNNITTPIIYGGSGISSRTDFISTSGIGAGTSLAFRFLGGTNGGTEIIRADNNGLISFGGNFIGSSISISLVKNITGATSAGALFSNGTIMSDVTATARTFYQGYTTQAASFTLTNLINNEVDGCIIGAGSAITNQYGYKVNSTLITATNNYGFHGSIAAASNRWNIYMNGTAQNYLGGNLGIGQTVPTALLHIKAGTATASTAPIKLTSGTDLTSAEAGSFEYNGTRLSFSPSTTRKRVLLSNDVAPANGQIPIGNTTDFTIANITAGSGITVTNGSGTITIAATGAMSTTEVTGTTQSMAVNTRYITNNVSQVVCTLPTTAALGDIILLNGKGTGGWKIAQNASQTIHGSTDTTTGTGGSLSSSARYNSIYLVCTIANTDWTIQTSQGTITVV